MSARAIRKLREDRAAAVLAATEEEDESDEEEEEEPVSRQAAKKSAFAMMNDDSSSSDEEEEDDENAEGSAKSDDDHEQGSDEKKEEKSSADKTETDAPEQIPTDDPKEDEENLDALLEEFKEHDEKKQSASKPEGNSGDAALEPLSDYFQVVVRSNVDMRDLDVDHVMRTSLLSAEPARETNNNNSNKGKRRNRQTFLFGNPRDLNVNVKPPHYVGGGIGMSTYDRENERTIPWPYNSSGLVDNSNSNMTIDTLAALQDRRRWFTFLNSDSYDKDCQDFERIQASGDMNALVLFVAHHPFVTEALVTLGMMLYHANQQQEGLTFLRRALWVYESATLSSFSSRIFQDSCLMDCDQPENQTYFKALFKLARVNNMAGLPRASFAVGRYILALDPLRDPTDILLTLDCYALSTNADHSYQWVVDLVESNEVPICYKDKDDAATTTTIAAGEKKEYWGRLTDLPNWAYSYALALYRLNDSRASEKANQTLQSAISNFPSIVDLLLRENDIDTSSRSCRIDWQAVIDYTGTRANEIHGAASSESDEDPVVRMATDKAYDLVSRIFAKLNAKLWAGDDVMLWLHNNLRDVKNAATDDDNDDNRFPLTPLSPALMRYSQVDPDDFSVKFQLLPAEANPLDMGLVQHALVIDPNRRRFLRNQQRGGGGGQRDLHDFLFQDPGNAAVRHPTLFGPPRNNIDLDLPMMEIFWRALLPWNRIDEIPRPRP